MSWLDNLEQKLAIVTGDGKQWQPLYVKSRRARDFNNAEFNYVNVTGTDVKRRLPKSHRYTLEIIFAGDNCIDDALDFDKSAADPLAWTLQHPIYGRILVQPLDLAIDNSAWSVSRITCTIVETNSATGVRVEVNAPSKISAVAFAVSARYADTYSTLVPLPPTSALQAMTTQVNGLYGSISKRIANASDSTAFLNAYNDANTLINNTFFDTTQLVTQIQQLSLLPASFVALSIDRVFLIGRQFATLFYAALLTAPATTRGVYEFNGGTSLVSMCAASITNYSYNTRTEVVNVIDTIINSYNTHLDNLDNLQANNGSEPGAYIADPGPLGDVTDLVNYTLATLYGIAEQSKQVRTVLLPEDTTVTLATYNYFGLDANDANIEQFIAVNSIGLNELLILKKGRKIIYFV